MRTSADEQFRTIERRFSQVDLSFLDHEKHFVALRGDMENLANILRAELHKELRLHLLAMFSLSATIAGIVAAAFA
jgi:hypothetical protein